MKFLRRMRSVLGLSEGDGRALPEHRPPVANAVTAYDFVAVDVETANTARHSICQVGLVAYRGNREVLALTELIDPEEEFDAVCVAVHGITASHVRGRGSFRHHQRWIIDQLAGVDVVSHSSFDRQALVAACGRHGAPLPDCRWIDTVKVARAAWPDLPNHKLPTVAEHIGHTFDHHDALQDARAAARIAIAACETLGIAIGDLAGLRRQREAVRGARPTKMSHGSGAGSLVGHYVTITGELWADRQSIAHAIAEQGGGFSPGVTRKTTMLVVGEGGAGTAKHQAALAARAAGRNLEILDGPAFRRRFKV